jgi:hypothetical protein
MYSVVRDVCEEGFDLIDAADAVFLDLPHPWKVVPHAKIALKVSIRMWAPPPPLASLVHHVMTSNCPVPGYAMTARHPVQTRVCNFTSVLLSKIHSILTSYCVGSSTVHEEHFPLVVTGTVLSTACVTENPIT